MRLGLTYKDILKHSPRGGEAKMWDAVERVDRLIDKLREEEPEMARDFLKGEYEAMNGRHVNEWLAKEMVNNMWHYEDGKTVKGEAVTHKDAMGLLDGMDEEKREKMQWDAYVAANAFMHDMGGTKLSESEIMDAARHFWFHDDDMGDTCHKVYWYFEDWIFG